MFKKLHYCLFLFLLFSAVNAQQSRLEKLLLEVKEKKLDPKTILEIETLAESSNNEKAKMDAYIVLGDTYRDLEVYDKAHIFYYKMLHLAEKNKLTTKIGMFKEALGSIQFRLGKFDKAIQLYTESKRYYQKANDAEGMMRAKGNIALVYLQMGKTQQAIESFTAIINEKNVTQRIKASALLNLGAIYQVNGGSKQAIKYYLDAVTAIKAINNNRQLIMAYQNLAESCLSLKQYENAYDYNHQSEILLQKEDSNELKSYLYYYYAEINKAKSEYKEAINNLDQYYKYKELSDNSRHELISDNIETLNKIESQKQLFQNEKLVSRLRIMFLILILIGVLIFVFYLVKRQRTKVKTLSHVINQTEDKLEFTQTKTEKMVMNIVKNNDFIERFKDNLKQVQKTTKDSESKSELGKLLSELQNFKLINDNKEELFNEVDAQFFYKLEKKFPSLTEEERKICVLIYLDLKNKDMAVILNLSVRSVENSRYRIRKKMDLDSNDSLSVMLRDL